MAVTGGTLFEVHWVSYYARIQLMDTVLIKSITGTKRMLKDSTHEGPFLIHAITQKGKGYSACRRF